MLDKAFYKSMYGSFGKTVVYRKGKSIFTVSVPIRTKHCPSMVKVVQCNQSETR